MMVGSELPSPETREKTVRPRSCSRCATSPSAATAARSAFNQLGKGDAASQSVVTQASTKSESTVPDTALRALDRRVVRGPRAARSSASPASRATGRPSSSRRSWACASASGHRARWTARTSAGPATRRAPSPASGTSPRTASATAWCSTFPLWENVLLGHQGGARSCRGGFVRPRRGPRPDRSRSSPSSTCARRHRGPGVHALRRQPAEADRRARDDERPQGAARLPPDARRRRRRPGGRSGTSCATPGARRAGHAAHLGRPRGADRALRPAARDAARADRGRGSTRRRSPRSSSART